MTTVLPLLPEMMEMETQATGQEELPSDKNQEAPLNSKSIKLEKVDNMLPLKEEEVLTGESLWLSLPFAADAATDANHRAVPGEYCLHLPEEPPKQEKPSPTPEIEKSRFMLLDPVLSDINIAQLSIRSMEEILEKSNSSASLDNSLNQSLDSNSSNQSHARVTPPKRRRRTEIDKLGATAAPSAASSLETSMLRRSLRKRSYQEMTSTPILSAATTSTPVSRGEAFNQIKRRRGSLSESMKNAEKDVHANNVVPESIDGVAITSSELKNGDVTRPTKDPAYAAINIILRKHKPVNPTIKIRKLEFKKKYFINARKQLAGELYCTHAILPRVLPTHNFNNPRDYTNITIPEPLSTYRIKEMMQLEWIKNFNIVAVGRSHGLEAIKPDKLTDDGNAVKGEFYTVDLDSQYDDLVKEQRTVADILGVFTPGTDESEAQVPAKSQNFLSVFSNYFDDNTENQTNKKDSQIETKNGQVVGVVPVYPSQMDSNPDFFEKRTVINYRGNLYRPNPVAVTLLRLNEEDIEAINSKPARVTMKSAFYGALTTYFDKKLLKK